MTALTAPQSTASSSLASEDENVLASRLKKLRRQHGLSLQQLSDRADLSIGTLSQVERGLSQPSLRTVRKLANAFGLSTAFFFDPGDGDDEAEDGIVFRDGKRPVMKFGGENMTAWMLSPKDLEGLQFMLVHLKPGAMSGRRNYEHSGLDLGFVLSGALNLEVEDRYYVLGAGDSFCFDSRRPHRFENRGETETVVVYINTQ